MNSERKREAILRSRTRVVDDAWEITFEISPPVEFIPGQYAWIILPELLYPDTRGNRRPFTILSPPSSPRELRFLFHRHNPSSGYKRTLLEMPLGESARIEAPFGSHVLPTDAAIPIVLIARGSGISSYMSMLRDMDEHDSWRTVSVLFANTSRELAPYIEELRGYAKAHPTFTLHEVEGRITREHLQHIRAPRHALWYLSGPRGMTKDVARLLLEEGASAANILCEEFPAPLRGAARPAFSKENLIDSDFYTLVVENAPNHMVFTDVEGIILYCNKAAEKMTGYTQEEMRGSTPRLWGGLMEREFYQRLWKTIKQGRKCSVENMR